VKRGRFGYVSKGMSKGRCTRGVSRHGVTNACWCRRSCENVGVDHIQAGNLGLCECFLLQTVGVLPRARNVGVEPNTVMYNIAISALAKSGRWEAAEKLFRQVSNPDSISYETMIAAYGMGGEYSYGFFRLWIAWVLVCLRSLGVVLPN
jgi:pentatricopeptide repeat protein